MIAVVVQAIFWISFLVCSLSAQQQYSVTLAWDPSNDPSVAGYNVYNGVQPSVYTNVVDVGLATQVQVSNLLVGVTYYFVATSYNTNRLESMPSKEIHFIKPEPDSPPLNMIIPVPSSGAWTVQMSQDLKTWIDIQPLEAQKKISDGTYYIQYFIFMEKDTPAIFYRAKQ